MKKHPIDMSIDKRAESRWNKSNKSYINYKHYISKKENPLELTFIDLLYVKNFKGGASTLNDTDEDIKRKLKFYQNIFERINAEFKENSLTNLDNHRVEKLITLAEECFALSKKKDTKIDGFAVSFISTLLHFHFPNLYPILDRRVLNGLGLIKSEHINKQGQVKNIQDFYPCLIQTFKGEMKTKDMRDIDREAFILPMLSYKGN